MECGDRQSGQCDQQEQHGLRVDEADGADAYRAERDDWNQHPAHIMPVEQVPEYRLQHIAGNRHHHDDQAAESQRKPEPGHDNRQQDRQKIAVEIIEQMPAA